MHNEHVPWVRLVLLAHALTIDRRADNPAYSFGDLWITRMPRPTCGSSRPWHDIQVRFYGTLKVELTDGTVEKFRDEEEAYKERWGSYRRWTHTMEKQWDESLVVTRHVEEYKHPVYDKNPTDSWAEIVGHYPANTWRKARFKD